jgi:hypothetical protein
MDSEDSDTSDMMGFGIFNLDSSQIEEENIFTNDPNYITESHGLYPFAKQHDDKQIKETEGNSRMEVEDKENIFTNAPNYITDCNGLYPYAKHEDDKKIKATEGKSIMEVEGKFIKDFHRLTMSNTRDTNDISDIQADLVKINYIQEESHNEIFYFSEDCKLEVYKCSDRKYKLDCLFKHLKVASIKYILGIANDAIKQYYSKKVQLKTLSQAYLGIYKIDVDKEMLNKTLYQLFAHYFEFTSKTEQKKIDASESKFEHNQKVLEKIRNCEKVMEILSRTYYELICEFLNSNAYKVLLDENQKKNGRIYREVFDTAARNYLSYVTKEAKPYEKRKTSEAKKEVKSKAKKKK